MCLFATEHRNQRTPQCYNSGAEALDAQQKEASADEDHASRRTREAFAFLLDINLSVSFIQFLSQRSSKWATSALVINLFPSVQMKNDLSLQRMDEFCTTRRATYSSGAVNKHIAYIRYFPCLF